MRSPPTYWTHTVNEFFTPGNQLSVNFDGTTINGGDSITVTFGPSGREPPRPSRVVSIDTNPPQQGSTPTSASSVTY